MKKTFCIVIIIVISSVLMICASSCGKVDPPKAIVMVIDDKTGTPVEGAMVILKPFESDKDRTVIYFIDRDKYLADTQFTNAAGKVFYDFKYKAIYKLEVTKAKGYQQPQERRGKGVLVLEEDKTVETTIRVNEQTVF